MSIAFAPMLALILIAVPLGLLYFWLTILFIAVIVKVLTMTPETASGRGSIPLVGDGKIPGTDVGKSVVESATWAATSSRASRRPRTSRAGGLLR